MNKFAQEIQVEEVMENRIANMDAVTMVQVYFLNDGTTAWEGTVEEFNEGFANGVDAEFGVRYAE